MDRLRRALGAGPCRARVSRRLAMACLVVVLLCGSLTALTGIVGAQQYSGLSERASDGVHHFRVAASLGQNLRTNPFDGRAVAQIRAELTAAHSDFAAIDSQVQAYPDGFAAIPGIGTRLAAARRLAPLAVQAAQAGLIGCDALDLLASRLANPLDKTSAGLTQGDLDQLRRDITQIQKILAGATSQIERLSPSDLALYPSLASTLGSLRQELPGISQALKDAQDIVTVAPSLLGVGQPTVYLIEVLDSTELRGSGGFIGNYGLATVTNGRLDTVHVQDVDLLDRPFYMNGGFVALPAQYRWFAPLNPNFNFRDSNLDPDFPTAARYGEQLYKTENGPGDPQGVIAVTPWLVKSLMSLTGPIRVDEYDETVTADGLVDAIHHHQLGKGHGLDTIPDAESGSTQRKRFTAYLFDHFFDKLKAVAATRKADLIKILLNAAHARDLQVYLNSTSAEAVLERYNLASKVEAPTSGDTLFVVDDNIAPNKANNFITYTTQDTVTLDEQGNALHSATLSYTWQASQHNFDNNYGNKYLYRGVVRVYAPPQSALRSSSGWINVSSMQASDRTVWQGTLYLAYGATGKIQLSWTVPGAARKSADGWIYNLLIQKQAGVTRKVGEQISLPSCARITGVSKGLTILNPKTPAIITTATADLALDVNYSC